MTLPVQPDKIDEGRQAVAPYNFVPLPELIVTQRVEDLPDQGKFHPDRLTEPVYILYFYWHCSGACYPMIPPERRSISRFFD